MNRRAERLRELLFPDGAYLTRELAPGQRKYSGCIGHHESTSADPHSSAKRRLQIDRLPADHIDGPPQGGLLRAA